MSDATGFSSDQEHAQPVGSTHAPMSTRRRFQIGSLRITGKRRRPTGQKPALPSEMRASGKFWLLMGLGVAVTWVTLFEVPGAAEFWTRRDLTLLLRLEDLRTDAVTTVMKAINFLTSDAVVRIMRWGTLAVLVFYKRWRHLAAGIAAIAIVEATAALMAEAVARPRPLVEILVQWEGYAHPSNPVASLAVTLGVMGYSLIPRGRIRSWWFIGSGALMVLISFSRIYLGVDHPSDAWVSLGLAISVTVVIYKVFVPESVWPVSYQRGNTAHLDVSGKRGEAVKHAVKDQLGVEVLNLKHVGLEGSAGSTPLLLTCASTGEDPDQLTFGKLYAQSHLRADRWYKWGRTLLYGSLEDEVRFGSVRRLVEYEDYLSRVMRDAGIPTAEPFGFVEITPEREYLIVTEFLDGAAEIGDATIDEDIIDQGLAIVRQLWDAGLAHRDLKPANAMVRDGQVVLIDTAFGQIRPSPWRQAVDLANMMLVLALGSNAQTVYDHALEQFTPDDVAEAFAATHGVSIPSQLRRMIKQHQKDTGEDLIETFRALAPSREPISIQRWSARRIFVAATTLLVGFVTVAVLISNLLGKGFL
jgi:tRNA A-37 threonylcarbamoyl transferase component Bud32/membrane-associated phospholipid phosphatase